MSTKERNKDKDKGTLKGTNHTLTPCDTVVGIPELQELILRFMASSSSRAKDLKHCALVSRLWQSYFRSYVWESLTLGRKVNKGRIFFHKDTGILVRRLTITCATRFLVNIIPEFFPHITYLSLAIGFDSDGIRYGHLQRLFTLLQDSLTEVQISFEMSVYQSSILWSLSSLPRLRRLDLKVFYPASYPEWHFAGEVCVEVLECCLGLEAFEFEFLGRYCFKYMSLVHQRMRRWVQWRMDSWSGLAPTPSSPQEALASSGRNVVRLSRQTSAKQERVDDPSMSNTTKCSNIKSSLRRLYFKEMPPNIVAFDNIITTHGPGLEELAINGQEHHSFSQHVWRSVLEICQFLRILEIADCGPFPSISTLVSSLPRLQALLINFRDDTARYIDLGLSELGASLEKHRSRYGGREHPLKVLEFGGWIDRPDLVMETLVTVLLQDSTSSQVEGLRMCYGSRCFMTPPMYLSILSSSVTPPSSSSPSPTRLLPTTTLTTTLGSTSDGRSLKDTLVQLDISFEQFQQYSEGKQFFERLQGFHCLRVLHVMHTLLWILDRMHNESNTSTFTSSFSPHNANANANSNSNSSRDTHHQLTTMSHDDDLPLPETNLHFPSIQELHIGYGNKGIVLPLNHTPANAVTLELAKLVVAMMPGLRVFVLADKAAVGVRQALRKRFRGIVFEGDQS